MEISEEAKNLMEKVIEKAKRYSEEHGGSEERRWLEATPEYSYGDERYMVKIFVQEGSPPKGYIVTDYFYGIVKVLRMVDLAVIRTYRAYEKGKYSFHYTDNF